MPVMNANRERAGDAGGRGEPEQAPRPGLGRVEPRRERHRQCERPVEVVELLRRALVVGEEQEADPDLCNEERLRERQEARVVIVPAPRPRQ